MKWIVIVVALCLLPHLLFAQAPQNTYLGVFMDDSRTTWCVTGDPPYQAEIWVWALPGVAGLKGAAFDLWYPGVVLDGDWVLHPNMDTTPQKCTPPCPDFSRGYLDCQSSWVWLFHQTILVTSSDHKLIEIRPFPADSDHVSVWDCDGVEQSAVILSKGYINHCGPVPVETKTWGAIKSLYR